MGSTLVGGRGGSASSASCARWRLRTHLGAAARGTLRCKCGECAGSCAPPEAARRGGTTQPSSAVPVVRRFEEAQNLFYYQDYAGAARALAALLYPKVELHDAERVVKAREMLAAAYWFLGKRDRARQEFTLLLLIRPAHKLDPFQYPPEMIAAFEALRDELAAQGVLPEAPRGKTGVGAGTRPAEGSRFSSPPPWPLVFVPFGAGQFAEGYTRTGWALLVTEVAAGVAAGTLWWAVYARRTAAPDTARRLQTAFWIAQGVFAGVAVGGVVHAVVVRARWRSGRSRGAGALAPDPAPSVLVAPWGGPGAGGVQVRGTW